MARADPGDEPSLGLAGGWARRPGDYSLVIMRDPSSGARVAADMRWGLRRERGLWRKLFIRAESLTGRGPFRDAARRRRLIIPMDGYVQRASRGEAESRSFAVSLKEDAAMAVAGLWAEEEAGPAFAVLTQRANDAIAAIHDRMPAVLPPEAWPTWLSDDVLPTAELAVLLEMSSPDLFRVEELTRRPGRKPNRPKQLDLLGLDAAAVQAPPTRRRRKAAAARIAREHRRALG